MTTTMTTTMTTPTPSGGTTTVAHGLDGLRGLAGTDLGTTTMTTAMTTAMTTPTPSGGTTTVAHGLDGLRGLAGTDLGTTGWLEITQGRVNTFADATDDHQWIHVDTERAAAGPFGAPIAHGYLTVSLLIPLFAELLDVQGVGMGVNYGLDKLRFPSPVRVGSPIRLHGTVDSVEDVSGDGVQVCVDFTVEVEGSAKPACVARAVYRYYPQ